MTAIGWPWWRGLMWVHIPPWGQRTRPAVFAPSRWYLWNEQHHTSTLTYRDVGDEILLSNTRPHFDWRQVEFRAPEEVHVFRMLDQPRSEEALRSGLESAGIPLREGAGATVRRILAEWRRLGLIFTDEGRHLHVATTPENQQLCRISRRREEALA